MQLYFDFLMCDHNQNGFRYVRVEYIKSINSNRTFRIVEKSSGSLRSAHEKIIQIAVKRRHYNRGTTLKGIISAYF